MTGCRGSGNTAITIVKFDVWRGYHALRLGIHHSFLIHKAWLTLTQLLSLILFGRRAHWNNRSTMNSFTTSARVAINLCLIRYVSDDGCAPEHEVSRD